MSRKAPKSLAETLSGTRGHVPAELLLDSRVSDSGKVLYALIRCFGPGRDTRRKKDLLAAALGWSEAKIHRVARDLVSTGWLTKTRARINGSWTSNWEVKSLNPESLKSNTLTSESLTNERARLSPVSEEEALTSERREPPFQVENHPRAREGLSSSIQTKARLVEAALRSLTSWDRDHAPAGWEVLRDSLVEVLDRRALPNGTSEATLVHAFLDRVKSRKPLRGITSPEGLLIRSARLIRGQENAADVESGFEELLARGLARLDRLDEPEGFLDLSTVDLPPGLADSLASPETSTGRPPWARSRA